jgi:hypothetical protein
VAIGGSSPNLGVLGTWPCWPPGSSGSVHFLSLGNQKWFKDFLRVGKHFMTSGLSGCLSVATKGPRCELFPVSADLEVS